MPTPGKSVIVPATGKVVLGPQGRRTLFDASGAACDCCGGPCDVRFDIGAFTAFEATPSPEHPFAYRVNRNGTQVDPADTTNDFQVVEFNGTFYSEINDFSTAPVTCLSSAGWGSTEFPAETSAYRFSHPLSLQSISMSFNVTFDWQVVSLLSPANRFVSCRVAQFPMENFGLSSNEQIVVGQVLRLLADTPRYAKYTEITHPDAFGNAQQVQLPGWVNNLAIEMRVDVIPGAGYRVKLIVNGQEFLGQLRTGSDTQIPQNPPCRTWTIGGIAFAGGNSPALDIFKSVRIDSIRTAFNDIATQI